MELVLALAHGITKRHHVAFFTIFWGSKSNFGRVHSQHKGSKCVHRNRDLLQNHCNFMNILWEKITPKQLSATVKCQDPGSESGYNRQIHACIHAMPSIQTDRQACIHACIMHTLHTSTHVNIIRHPNLIFGPPPPNGPIIQHVAVASCGETVSEVKWV